MSYRPPLGNLCSSLTMCPESKYKMKQMLCSGKQNVLSIKFRIFFYPSVLTQYVFVAKRNIAFGLVEK